MAAIELDHLLIPSRDRVASARLLAQLLGVPWSEEGGVGPFSPVYVNDGLTLDFDEMPDPPKQHFCFRVSEADFEAILGRIRKAGIPFRSTPMGPVDNKVNRSHGGMIAYWSEPDGHAWEILTVSYARRNAPA
jgi:hypothetical protein